MFNCAITKTGAMVLTSLIQVALYAGQVKAGREVTRGLWIPTVYFHPPTHPSTHTHTHAHALTLTLTNKGLYTHYYVLLQSGTRRTAATTTICC